MTWDGTSWQVADLPLPNGTVVTYVESIACLPASLCTVTGSYSADAPLRSLIETTSTQPPPQLAESPVTLAIPVLALGLFGGSASRCRDVGRARILPSLILQDVTVNRRTEATPAFPELTLRCGQ